MTMLEPMQTWFNHVAHTRIVALPSIGDVDRPELGELLSPDAVDLSCDITENGGLNVGRPTEMSTFTPWWGNHHRSYPSRWIPSVGMIAPVPTLDRCALGHDTSSPDCCFGALWELSCKFRSPVVIVVRRGPRHDVPWSVGQRVEVIYGRWGARDVMTFNNGPALFTVPLGVIQEAGFDPDADTCGAFTTIVPGSTPLPCGLRLCTGDGVPLCTEPAGDCLVNCSDDEGEP